MKKIYIIITALSVVGATFGQGPLTPSGAPAPTMKTLNELDTSIKQVAGRIPISHPGYIITEPGSYYLTTNLVTTTNQRGITINTSNVTVDLNGFSILGAGASGSGILMNYRDNVTIKNGTIRDCYYSAIYAPNSKRCTFENLKILNNSRASGSSSGIYAGRNSKIVNNQILDNGGYGLRIYGSGSYIKNNIVKGNYLNYDLSQGNHLNLLLSEVPVTIKWPCKVEFAGTLTCTNQNQNAISIESDNVTINMNEHTLIGSGTDHTYGIYQSNTYKNLHVLNGNITHWTGSGSRAINAEGFNGSFENISVSTNFSGIFVSGINAIISNCRADNNTWGIYGGQNSLITKCRAYQNLLNGIEGENGSIISQCTAYKNGQYGIQGGASGKVIDCTSNKNRTGFDVGYLSIISGCVASKNQTEGIQVSSNSLVYNNNCSKNGGAGILLKAGKKNTRIENNNVTLNKIGIKVSYKGNIIIRNTVGRNTDNNWSVVTGNACYVVQATYCSAISGNSGGTSPGSTNPYANFTY